MTAARLKRAPIGAPRFISYIRVSTNRQAIGPEAQREAVDRLVRGRGGIVLAEFSEIETGTNKRKRPQLKAALAACKLRRAVLVIAKLDRLARNVHFTSGLIEAGVEFLACDHPHANKLTVHVMSAFAEHEAEAIATRTREALAVVKAAIARDGSWVSRRSGQKITRLGNPHLAAGDTRRARAAKKLVADQYAAELGPVIDGIRSAGAGSLGAVAAALERLGYRTPQGSEHWTRSQVRRAEARWRSVSARKNAGCAA